MSLVLREIENNIAVLTLNHPERLNALSRKLIGDLTGALEGARVEAARAVILRAPAGARIWSAGHDIKELDSTGDDPQTYDDPLRRAVRAISEFPAPVIAMIEGGVWGGACELAMSCDMIVAAPGATFAITPAKLGVAYSLEGTLNFMKAVGLPLLREMLFTAHPVPAERALGFGMINHLVPAENIEAFTLELAGKISQNSPLCISLLKEELRLLAEAHPMTPDAFERMQSLRRCLYRSQDYREGVCAFLEKRRPEFKGR